MECYFFYEQGISRYSLLLRVVGWMHSPNPDTPRSRLFRDHPYPTPGSGSTESTCSVSGTIALIFPPGGKQVSSTFGPEFLGMIRIRSVPGTGVIRGISGEPVPPGLWCVFWCMVPPLGTTQKCLFYKYLYVLVGIFLLPVG